MNKWFTLLLTAVLVFSFAAPITAQEDVVSDRLQEYGGDLPDGYGLITVEETITAIAEGNTFLLDVRQPEEYEAGHIQGAVPVPLREVGQNLDLLPGINDEIIVICQGGYRAMIAGAALQVLGYENVRILKGGFGAWVGENLPTVTEPTEGTPGDVPAFDPVLQEAITDLLLNLPEGWGIVQANDLAAELAEDAPILIDVRSQGEYDSVGYIRGAQHIWINEFMANMDQWPADKDANIVVYCASSYRGNIAFVMMRLMGYTNVRNLAGGMNSWLSAGLPVEGAAPVEATAEFDLQSTLTSYVDSLPPTFNALRVEDLEAKFANEEVFTLIDVRTADEYAEGFIEGAINMPLQELTDYMDLLPDTSADIVIYCGSGHRSTLAMVALNVLGYENATSLLGGTRAWTNSELPLSEELVEATPATAPDFDAALFEAVDGFIKSIPTGYWITRADDLNTLLIEDAPVLVDVRTEGEYANGFIPTAVNIPLSELMIRFDEWPEDTSAAIVFYGSTSHRGALAMSLARMLGYENATSLGGGTGSWVSSGLSLTQ